MSTDGAGVPVHRAAMDGERCGEVRAPAPRRRVPIAGRPNNIGLQKYGPGSPWARPYCGTIAPR